MISVLYYKRIMSKKLVLFFGKTQNIPIFADKRKGIPLFSVSAAVSAYSSFVKNRSLAISSASLEMKAALVGLGMLPESPGGK